jgi:hypothetical protein
VWAHSPWSAAYEFAAARAHLSAGVNIVDTLELMAARTAV